jgi:mRNA interferase MazF
VEVKRGEIYFANLGDSTCNIGSEQDGYRPVLIIQNNIGNHYSPTVIVACVTTKIYKANLPTHIKISQFDYGLTDDNLILCEQIKTIDKVRLRAKLTELTPPDMKRVDNALKLSLELK